MSFRLLYTEFMTVLTQIWLRVSRPHSQLVARPRLLAPHIVQLMSVVMQSQSTRGYLVSKQELNYS